jgi:hypothetical protein
VLRGHITVTGAAYTVYQDTEPSVDVRIDLGAWSPAAGAASWSFDWNTSRVPDGPHIIEARATAKGASAYATVNVTVDNAMRGLIWFKSLNPPGNSSIFEGDRAYFRAEAASDPPAPGGLQYEWRLDGAPAASGNEVRNYTYQSDFRSSGLRRILVTATTPFNGSVLSVSYSWNLTVVNVNRPPVIDSVYPNGTAVQITGLRFQDFRANATDPDGDPLSYRWTLDGLTLNGTGGAGPSLRLQGLKAGTHALTVTVSDGELNVSRSWTVTVKNDTPPVVRDNTLPCVIAGVLAGVAGLLLLIVIVRRRRRIEEF